TASTSAVTTTISNRSSITSSHHLPFIGSPPFQVMPRLGPIFRRISGPSHQDPEPLRPRRDVESQPGKERFDYLFPTTLLAACPTVSCKPLAATMDANAVRTAAQTG